MHGSVINFFVSGAVSPQGVLLLGDSLGGRRLDFATTVAARRDLHRILKRTDDIE
jgi:hypothetical protein